MNEAKTARATAPLFEKILIANRGEIACRVIQTCRRLGIRTVAVFSDADAGARHVRLADEAIHIGPAPARDSYLVVERIMQAVDRSNAQAVHPGYGFLSENEAFAAACAQAGIRFIGPPVEAIRAMGSKSAAKSLMEKAGVPLVPGYHGERQEPAFLQAEADRIGYPVLIKASAGGGGKGMRVVERPEQFGEMLASCQREAKASFADAQVLIEKYLQRPRHIEIQVFGDTHGNIVHLFERDCSVQRRHQKVIEEAPAPGMTPERRAAMGQAAVEAARAVGYVGAGTVEFIADRGGRFYFMEMNTRLQVEHPVTEMITGQDLVEWQINVAGGAALPCTQEQLAIRGHAFEARIYAEDAERGFLPSTGRLDYFATPSESIHVRVDTGVEQGDEITPHYDPMIAKLIVWDDTRERALQRLRLALSECRIVGVTTNVEFLGRLIDRPSFASGDLDTGLIERDRAELFAERDATPAEVWAVATLAVLLRDQRIATPAGNDRGSPWHVNDGWRLSGALRRKLNLRHRQRERHIIAEYGRAEFRIEVDDSTFTAQGELSSDGSLTALIDGRKFAAVSVFNGDRLHLLKDGRSYLFVLPDPLTLSEDAADDHSGLKSPMPGKIIALLAKPGAQVSKGDALLVLEAMKMEHTIVAPAAGRVTSFHFAVGDQVKEGADLLHFDV